MNAYLASVLESVKTKHGNEPEFVQTVEEVLSSLEPVIEKHPEYEKVDLLGRMVEPERMFTFRVVWCDDNGQDVYKRQALGVVLWLRHRSGFLLVGVAGAACCTVREFMLANPGDRG